MLDTARRRVLDPVLNRGHCSRALLGNFSRAPKVKKAPVKVAVKKAAARKPQKKAAKALAAVETAAL